MFRFKYVTDENINNIGFYIDDIYPVHWFEQINYYDSIADTNYYCSQKPLGDYYYMVKPVDNLGTSGKWSNQINVKVTTVNINEDKVQSNIKIQPNPFTDHIYISSPLKADIKIFNQHGILITNINKFNSEVVINTKEWPGGLYFIKVGDNKAIKIIKQ